MIEKLVVAMARAWVWVKTTPERRKARRDAEEKSRRRWEEMESGNPFLY